MPDPAGRSGRRGWGGRATAPVLLALACLLAAPAGAQPFAADELPARAIAALRRAAEHLTGEVAVDGGYPLRVEGELRLGPDGPLAERQASVDATVTLGEALLAGWAATDDPLLRDAALAGARALAAAQLASGGWTPVIDVGEEPAAYTRRLAAASVPPGERPVTSDLGITPAALAYLAAVAARTGDGEVADAHAYGTRALLQAQLAGGGWPAAWPLPADERRLPTVTVTAAAIEALLAGGQPEAAARGGDFLLLARLAPADGPEGWAARYEPSLAPRGGRDPEATAAAVAALLALGRSTGEERFLTALPGVLTGLEDAALAAAAQAALRGRPLREPSREERARLTAARAPEVAALLAELDEQGRWLTDGALDIGEQARRLALLADFVAEYEPLPERLPAGGGRPPQHRRP